MLIGARRSWLRPSGAHGLQASYALDILHVIIQKRATFAGPCTGARPAPCRRRAAGGGPPPRGGGHGAPGAPPPGAGGWGGAGCRPPAPPGGGRGAAAEPPPRGGASGPPFPPLLFL